MKHLILTAMISTLLFAGVNARGDIALSSLSWEVQYVIDNSQTDFGVSQSTKPRDNRGLAISPDGRYLYAGYNNGPEVRKIDLTIADVIDASVARTTAVRGKAIAVDDIGRVYCAEGSSGGIYIFNADLDTQYFQINNTQATQPEGIAVVREGDVLALYATDRTNKTLTRWALTESGGAVIGAVKSGLDGDGVISITGAGELRGCEVDPLTGKIWMADYGAGKVWRVDPDGTGLTSVDVAAKPIDIGFDGGQVFVTQYTTRTLTVLNELDMSFVASISVPWSSLDLDSDGQSGAGALSGIVVLPNMGLYLANEAGQTADEKSTYGRIDAKSGTIGGTFYTDMFADDNDPILHAVPEPATMGLLALGGIGAIIRRRRTAK